MAADIIQANYEQLEALAGRFQQQADLIQQMTQRVNRSAGALKDGGWQGKGVDAFTREMESKIFPAVGRLEQALTEAQKTTLQISAAIRAAEEEAASRFNGEGEASTGTGTPSPKVGGAAPIPIGGEAPGGAAFIDQILDRGRANVNKVFEEDYMKDMIGRVETGADSSQLNSSMEQLLSKVRSGQQDMASVGPILDEIARQRGVDPAVLRDQYQNVFLPLWENAESKGDIDLSKHGDFMGSTISLRYGRVVGDVFGMDPVFGAILKPTGGLVGPGDSSYQPANDDAIGYHGIFHDAGGYLYNNQSNIGPGYNYMNREPFPKDHPFTGQVGGISWWASHPELDVDILPHVMPDIPYVPRFVEQGIGTVLENPFITPIRQGIYIFEGGSDIVSGIGDVFTGNWSQGGDSMLEGTKKIVGGTIRNLWDAFN